MATTRKAAPKKAAKTTKKAAPKKTRKVVATKSVKKTAQSTLSHFWKVDFTINTVYWLVIGIAVIATAFIAVENNQRLNDLYDRIDATQAQADQ